MQRSLVEYYAEHERYKCGYCQSPDTNFSHGAWAHTLTVSDYQDLIDRGWRRSGKYCYKPTMNVTCCPMYTIRCDALNYKSSKSQKKVLKRFNKFLMGDDMQGNSARKMSTGSSGSDVLGEGYEEGFEPYVETMKEHQDIDLNDMSNYSEEMENAEVIATHSSQDAIQMDLPPRDAPSTSKESVKRESGPDPNKPPCRKAKLMRQEKKLEKLGSSGFSPITHTVKLNKEKQIEDFLNDLPDSVKHKLEIKLVRTNPPSPEWLASAKESHELYVKYQMIIHNDKLQKCTESKFKEFLVSSPLLEEYKVNGPTYGYGSFHQQYWVNKKLIAVGVIDILPKCVSSVYFFYDPKYMNLTLGTYGALREIQFTRQLNSTCPDIKYYYMGYYVHSCKKMKYKGNYSPSHLLCPETYKWFPIKDCIHKLELNPYSRLDPDVNSVDVNCPIETDINYIPVWVKNSVMLYKTYKRKQAKNSQDHDKVVEYARLVGTKTAKSVILVL